ncbi:MAG: translation initiation factor IF-2 [Candidatus Omnitrophica bacterium]|nr:translation initiation factor IF-2 [Candidatus Omnitrophota bacterium]
MTALRKTTPRPRPPKKSAGKPKAATPKAVKAPAKAMKRTTQEARPVAAPARSMVRVGAQVRPLMPLRPPRPTFSPPSPKPAMLVLPPKTVVAKPVVPPKPAPPIPAIVRPPAPAPLAKPALRPVVPPSAAPPAAVKVSPAPPTVKPAPPPMPAPGRVESPILAPAPRAGWSSVQPAAPRRPAPVPPRPYGPAGKPAAPKPAVPAPPVVQAPRTVSLQFPISVKDLAEKLSVSSSEVIKRLLAMKVMATINQSLPEAVATDVAKSFNAQVERLPTLEEELTRSHDEAEDPAHLVLRPPVVTMMGHVDHGKTSLLDAIRKSKVTEQEAGGITQHIGAYKVHLPKGWISFLDTPGHEAFTAMRARGAHVTDIVILVVAADDGVMPQTVEAIDHAKAADATIVVALNKMDKPEANPDKVKRQLMEVGLMPEEWGGKTVIVPVSAKTGDGIDQLLELMLLEAEMLELKANPAKPAKGLIIEAELSKGGGPVATVLVQNGTLRVGDLVVAGPHYGRVRAMLDDRGHRVQEAGPSMPVEILGLGGVPKAGNPFFVVTDERKARELTSQRQEIQRQAGLSAGRKIMSLEEFQAELKAGIVKELNIVLKGDVQGSVEALKASLEKLSTDQVQLKVLHAGVGAVNESDILLAVASNAIVIGFHVAPTTEAETLAKEESVDVRLYQIIYEAIGEVRAAMEGLLEPKLQEVSLGRAKVLQVFKVSKVGTVAGSQVVKGKLTRAATYRVVRGSEKLFEGRVASLKRFKDDVREVAEGLECGIALQGWDGYQPGDLIEAFEVQKVAQTL